MKMRQPEYLKCIVIVHGKSEKQICDYVKQQLRMRLEVFANHGGKNSIQITGLKKILSNSIFKNFFAFTTSYEDAEIITNKSKKSLSPDFKIFIIMDTDDCTTEEKDAYKTKQMFKGHWLYNYIVPIYNSPELEPVLIKAGISFRKKGGEQKSEYIQIFPTDPKNKKSDLLQIEEFEKMLRTCKNTDTNMQEFINFCLLKKPR